jgi:hypothetical protein
MLPSAGRLNKSKASAGEEKATHWRCVHYRIARTAEGFGWGPVEVLSPSLPMRSAMLRYDVRTEVSGSGG